MLVTQRAAKKAIKDATGLSVDSCYRIVKQMDKVKDGERYKVYSSDVDTVINAYKRPVQPARPRTVTPMSSRMASRVMVSGK
jgi:hypothetical protein